MNSHALSEKYQLKQFLESKMLKLVYKILYSACLVFFAACRDRKKLKIFCLYGWKKPVDNWTWTISIFNSVHGSFSRVQFMISHQIISSAANIFLFHFI